MCLWRLAFSICNSKMKTKITLAHFLVLGSACTFAPDHRGISITAGMATLQTNRCLLLWPHPKTLRRSKTTMHCVFLYRYCWRCQIRRSVTIKVLAGTLLYLPGAWLKCRSKTEVRLMLPRIALHDCRNQQQHLCLLQLADFGLEQADLLCPAPPLAPSLNHFAKGGFISNLLGQRPGHLILFCLEQVCL